MATVETLITDQRTFAAQLVAESDIKLDRMQSDMDHLGYNNVYFPGLVLPDAPDIPDDLIAPTLATIDLVLPTEPGAVPAFQAISPIETGTTPTLTAIAPIITLPSLPSQLGGFNELAPAINTSYTFPTAPDQLVNPTLTAPVLTPHAVPTAPVIALPSFDSVAPTNDTVAPTDLQAQFIAAYSTAAPQFMSALNGQTDAWLRTYNPRYFDQLSAIEDKLSAYMAGGTGLSPAVENQIYERSRTKNDAEARRASDAAFDALAGRGFTLPGPSVAASIRASRQAAADNNAIAAREIVVMQAEMEQKNLQWAMNLSATMRTQFLSAALTYHSNLVQINGQAVQYATSVVDTMVRAYNISVEAFKLRLSIYQVDAEIYSARVKAAMLYVTLFQAEIDALKALVQVDEAQVALYRGQIDGLLGLANLYKTRVDVVVAQAGLEKLKLDVFKTQTEAYVATVQGKRAEYDAYTAAISGQEAGVRLYTARVSAYASELTGYKTRVEAQGEVVRAQVAMNEGIGQNYRTQLAGYQTTAQVRSDFARTQLQVNSQVYQAFDSQVRATLGNATLRREVYRDQTEVLMKSASLEVDTLLKNQGNTLLTSQAIANVGVAAARVFQGYASSYLSGMTTLISQNKQE